MSKEIKKSKSPIVTNFWTKLPRPFFTLAPMANVTDAAFRKLIAKYGKPDAMWTEFVSADGLASAGKKNLMLDLKYSRNEKPIAAQLFGSHPAAMREAAEIVKELGFDGIDINMGCPDRAVEKQGAGASLMKNPKLAIELIAAAREGYAAGNALHIQAVPISVKTRLGYNQVDWDWIKLLLGQKLAVLTIHMRTRKEMSDVSAQWDLMPKVLRLRDRISPDTLIIGNGDIRSLKDAIEKTKKYKCDGVMIGRGTFGDPWFFEQLSDFRRHAKSWPISNIAKTPSERLKAMVEHSLIFDKTFKGVKPFDVMKKHFKAYASGWDGAKELRAELMTTRNSKEVKKLCTDWMSHFMIR